MSHRHMVAALAALVPVLAGIPSSAQSASPDAAAGAPPAITSHSYGENLVVNGDAEAELGARDDGHIVKPSGWTTSGQFTAVAYGADGGFPTSTTPGPSNRGKSLFEGGNVAKSTASQTISLQSFAPDIASGGVAATFSSWIGGYSTQADYAIVAVRFMGAAGSKLAAYALGPVTVEARKGVTSLLHLSKTVLVPKAATSAVVSIVIVRKEGTYNDGSVDDVTLVLARK